MKKNLLYLKTMKFVTNFIVVLYSIFNIQQPSPRMTIKVFIVYIAGSGAFRPKGPSELIYRAPGTKNSSGTRLEFALNAYL